MGAAGGADGAERSTAGGGGGGGWSREVRRVCGAFLYLLLGSPAVATAAATERPSASAPRSWAPSSSAQGPAAASQHVVRGQETEDGRLRVSCLPTPLQPRDARRRAAPAPRLGRGEEEEEEEGSRRARLGRDSRGSPCRAAPSRPASLGTCAPWGRHGRDRPPELAEWVPVITEFKTSIKT